jgi:hypothetical protein
MPAHGKFPSPAARPGGKGLPSASQVFHQSLAAVDLGAESNSEALMDPSHPSELPRRARFGALMARNVMTASVRCAAAAAAAAAAAGLGLR